ncbi:MAG: hypothetical protein Satyrvirus8_29 [Satyrvirus sp.]|uniref:Uncharacterized protein n=1 Tax=Satyrvirus sp. TaxID=2487771 RepID=A0A3G5AG57_9VIRU|nr:MAG: hypothetical protein Satyrvirus8_29 [Satyrvirus sp.]
MDDITNLENLEIVGLNEKEYNGKKTTGGGEKKYKYHDAKLKEYIFNLVDKDGNKYELELYEEYFEGSCGYGISTYGRFNFRAVNDFEKTDKVPKKKAIIIFDMNIYDHIYNHRYETEWTGWNYKCEWFSFSEYNDDIYYPNGYVKVNMNLFQLQPKS